MRQVLRYGVTVLRILCRIDDAGPFVPINRLCRLVGNRFHCVLLFAQYALPNILILLPGLMVVLP